MHAHTAVLTCQSNLLNLILSFWHFFFIPDLVPYSIMVDLPGRKEYRCRGSAGCYDMLVSKVAALSSEAALPVPFTLG